jgi:hypothetical protein
MFDLKEYMAWLKARKIKKKALAQAIGYRYDHVVQVLNEKETLSEPFKKSLIMFRDLHPLTITDNLCKTCSKPILGRGYCSTDCAQVAFDKEIQ